MADLCVDGRCTGFEETVEEPFGSGDEVFVIGGGGTHTWGLNALTTTQNGEVVERVPADWLLPYMHQRYDDLSVLGKKS